MKHFIATLLGCLVVSGVAWADVPVHAEGLQEKLISVPLDGNRVQVGVYSAKADTQGHTKLAVLLPGYPSVVRPVVEDGLMVKSSLTGNFLIRARRILADGVIATLIVDCHSDSGDYCSETYQSSRERYEHVQKLISAVREKYPSLTEVWLVGNSMGTISSSFMPTYGPKDFAGAIHTATITEPYAQRSYPVLGGFNYAKAGIPQYLVHHANDPCSFTTYSGAKRISDEFNMPLITVYGGSGFKGDACHAQTEHGFKGMDKATMIAIKKIIMNGTVTPVVGH